MANGFASPSERTIVESVLHADFGALAAQAASTILRSEGLSVVELVQKLRKKALGGHQPTVHEVKNVLLKLLQHNILSVHPVASSPNTTSPPLIYKINVQETMHRLRFPKFLQQTEKIFGQEGEIVMEEVLVQGRVRLDQSLDAMAENLAEALKEQKKEPGDDSVEDEEISEEFLEECKERIHNAFIEMAKRRYIQRVYPLDLKVPEPEAKPDIPASLGGGSKPSESNGKKSSGNKSNKNGSKQTPDASPEQNDGITVKAKQKRRPKTTQDSSIPVELQHMLEADEKDRDDGEAEVDLSASNARPTKKRKLAKKAKLPGRGADIKSATSSPNSESTESESAMSLDQSCLVWRCGVDQIMRELRRETCVKFASENVNEVGGVLIRAILTKSTAFEKDAREPTSSPVTARTLFEMQEVKDALPQGSKRKPWDLLIGYLSHMCLDKSGMLAKVAANTHDPARANDGGQYVVHMDKIITFVKRASTHAYLEDRFGVASARIVRVLLQKRQVEQQTVAELALLPGHEARRRLYELHAAKLIKLQEVPKRADHNPAHTFYYWSLDEPELELRLQERLLESVARLRARRQTEAEENKELIARSDQLVEELDLKKFDRLSRALDRMDRAVVQLDAMLMLYREF